MTTVQVQYYRSRSQGHLTCRQRERYLGRGWPYQLRTWWKLSQWESTPVVYHLRQWAKQTGSSNMADFQHIKCKNQRKHRQIIEISHSKGNLCRGIDWWCLNLHRKFINNRFCVIRSGEFAHAHKLIYDF